ncbi:MAG TPA: GGDEF domain-containing protein [Candidatus Polarisedimenticolaceae bacterium]|nr:GGDEF domain-containing protein [Candidatus Polarisedimenticolaceae bacterium]
MPLRIVTLGRVAPALQDLLREAAAPDAVEPLHVPASIQGVEACLRQLEPDLAVVGEGTPWSGADLAHAGRDPRLLVPVLSATGDPEADLDLGADGRDVRAVVRAAVRLARLRRVARNAASPLAGAEATQGLRRLAAEFTRALRYRHPLSVVVLVLDRADALRETYGGEAVEGFAAALAQALADTLRTADFLFRSGDLQWVIGLPETPAAGARVVAQRLRTRTRTLVFKAPGGPAEEGRPALPLKGTASVGVADGPGPAVASAADLLARAQEAVGSARRAGGDRIVFAGTAPDLPVA